MPHQLGQMMIGEKLIFRLKWYWSYNMRLNDLLHVIMMESSTSDDICFRYWLYAAIKNKCLIVTNDEMRDHTFQLLGNDFFPKWKERHQVNYCSLLKCLLFEFYAFWSILVLACWSVNLEVWCSLPLNLGALQLLWCRSSISHAASMFNCDTGEDKKPTQVALYFLQNIVRETFNALEPAYNMNNPDV